MGKGPAGTLTAEEARGLFEQQRRSAKSFKAFAEGVGLTASQLYWWRKKFGREASAFVPEAARRVPFIPVVVRGPADTSTVAPSTATPAKPFVLLRMTNAMRTTTAEAIWRERVRRWRESGKTMREFAQGQAFAPATLRYWSSRLERSQAPPFVRVVPKKTVTPAAPGLVVEVGSARVRVASDFDPSLLAQVVRALAGEAR